MRKGVYIALLFTIMFMLPSLNTSGGSAAFPTALPTGLNSSSLLADGSQLYADNGAPLEVSFQGGFTTNASTWTATGQTYAEDLSLGTSFTVLNASAVSWTAYVSVSPPAEVEDVSFTVDYPRLEWVPVSVTDPLGVVKTTPADWTFSIGVLTVHSTAVTTYGLWKIEFLGWNHLYNLEFDLGASYGKTQTYDVGQNLEIRSTSSFITGGSTTFSLIDPSGSVWFSSTDTTSGSSSHEVPSFQYKKDITIQNAAVYGDFVDFPVMISLIDTGLHDAAQADGDDIIFVQNSIVLDHEIELYNPTYSGSEARLVAWVKANLSNTVDTVISMYYGNPIVGPQENPTGVWSQDYSGVYHLGETTTDEATGTVHADSTSNEYNAIQDGNDDAAGLIGRGQSFDGTDDQIIVYNTTDLEPVGDVTLSGWFRLTSGFTSSSPTSMVLMTKFLTGDHDMHIGLVGQDYARDPYPYGALIFKVENGAGALYKWSQRTTWGSGGWFYFACTIDEDAPVNDQIYVNGLPDTNSTTSGSAPFANVTFNGNWGFGGGPTDTQFPGTPAGGWFDGIMDEIRVSNTIRSSQWIQTEYWNQRLPGSFYVVGSETERTYNQPSLIKAIDATAFAGLWTARVSYNDTGTSVDHRVGVYTRNFIVQHNSALTLDSPGDAVGGGVSTRIAGDVLYVIVNLTDSITSAFVTGASVTMNWTAPATVILEDYGDGRYGKALNTTDLADARRWRINIQSSHSYYNDDSTFFDLDLYHDTRLTFDTLTTTPVGSNFEVSLLFKDAYDGSPISGATIRFANGTLVTPVWQGGGRYNLSLSSGGLSQGDHTYSFTASKSGSFMMDDTVDVTFTLRPHYTAVSVSGDLIVPYGEDTPLSVFLVDLDTGGMVPIGSVSSFTFTPSNYSSQSDGSPTDFDFLLITSGWAQATEYITLSLVISDSNYYSPEDYVFSVYMRPHYTSVSVSGNLIQPLGNSTPITVILTDLDTGGQVVIGAVASFSFASSYGTQVEGSLSSFNVVLTTGSWTVGITTVTLTVVMSSANYYAPDTYDFDVTIRELTTYMYNEPSTLRFSTGQDFLVTLRVNVSEPGPNYGLPVTGLTQGMFSVPGYTFTIDATEAAIGRYNLSISAASFTDGYHTIVVYVNPSSANYAGTSLVITFRYEPGLAALSSPSYPQVTTPFETDFQLSLVYEDADTRVSISGATIGGNITIYGQVGEYTIWVNVTGFAQGTHHFILWADHPQYQNKSLTFTLVIRAAFTYALPSVGALDIPLGNDPVFTVDFYDIDNGVPVSNESGLVTLISTWTGDVDVVYLSGPGLYQITFITTDTDSLVQNLPVTFTFSRPNYQNGVFTISVTIRTHTTDFRLVSAVEPTSFSGIINVSVYYGDVDNSIGITPLSSIIRTVENASGPVAFSTVDNGNGYYTIQISASQFGQGLQEFNITFSWSGVQKYQTKWLIATANVIGEDSRITLMIASDPTAYGEDMSYTFFYSDTAGLGITNTSNPYGDGNVRIAVSFQGETVDLGQVTIVEVLSEPGNYSITFPNSIFGRTGLVYMNVYINWTAGVAPFYTNRFDVISVRVLPRDTLVSVTPPSPTYYGETAWFIFTYEDLTGGSSVPIADDPALDISLSLASYSVNYLSGTQEFNVSFDTTQFGSPLGSKSFSLDVTWTGAPFYANRTGRTISVLLLARLTVLDYQAPAPTPYLDIVTFSVTWTDVTSGSTGLSGATLVLYNGITPINLGDYNVTDLGTGEYTVDLDTTYFGSPGYYTLIVEISNADFFINDISVPRTFNVRQRVTLLSAEPTPKLPYNSTLQFILNYQDLDTLGVIGNGSGLVTFEILNASTWFYTISWNGGLQQYEFTVETYNHPTLAIDTQYALEIRMTYANVAPFYGADSAYILFQLRSRASQLVLEDPSDPTPYLDFANFTVFYKDLDAITSTGIIADSITVWKGGVPLQLGTQYLVSDDGGGFYTLSVNTTALDGPFVTSDIVVLATWNPSISPFHNDASVTVTIRTVQRESNVEILIPPVQTPYLNNVSFTFAFYDLSRNTAITGITASDIELWAEGTLLTSGQFSMTAVGSNFKVSVNSTILSGVLVSNYNLTIVVDWNDGLSPYYFDDTTLVKVTIVGRGMTYSPEPISDADFGENITLAFRLSDAKLGVPVSGALISFDGQTVSLTQGVDFWISEGSGINIGLYTIEVDSNSLGGSGEFLFDLNISWNPSLVPYYLNLTTIEITGLVNDIDTGLVLSNPSQLIIAVDWRDLAQIRVNYTDLLNGVNIPDATVTWTWPFVTTGNLTYSPLDEAYSGNVDSGLADAGTYIITVTAIKENYQVAVAYVTLVIRSVKSDMILIEPGAVILIPKGSGINITIYLEDVDLSLPILDGYVIYVTAEVENTPSPFSFVYNGTPGFYSVIIPPGGATDLSVGFVYNIRLTALMENYEPATYLVRFGLTEIRTELQFAGETTEEIVTVYSKLVNITVRLIAPDQSNETYTEVLTNADVRWVLSEQSLSGTFTEIGNGYYYVLFNTTRVGYGIWGLSLRASPADAEYADTSSQLILTINRIQTQVFRPPTLEVVWGWAGYVNFTFWDTSFLTGIDGANVSYTLPGLLPTTASGVGDGNYTVFIDTSLMRPSATFVPLQISFLKPNYQEASDTLQILVRAVPTNLAVEISEINLDPDNALDAVVPYGDQLEILVFYNDTDNSDGFVGGLSGANLTLNEIFGPTRSLTGFDIEALGDGYYRFIFDTLDPWLFEQAIGPAGPQLNPYTLTFRLALDNRSTATINIHVTIIELPTRLEVIGNLNAIILYGASGTITVRFLDNWPGHPENTLIRGANLTIDEELSNTELLSLAQPIEDPQNPGNYIISYTADSPFIGMDEGTSDVTIVFSIANGQSQTVRLRVVVQPTELAILLTQGFTYGLPLGMILIALLAAYVRVWNVPKRLRQINGQIKTLRKGKIPSPVADAKSRSQLIADLFNATFTEVGITRVASQMPEESIEVAVPEMGELLIQLAILTNLDQDELDEFKADISKMRISEQAAFVREVIEQEALRAARREGKEIEQILEEVAAQARRRLSEDLEEGVEVEPIAPPEHSVVLDKEPIGEEPEVKEPAVEDVSDDRLSTYEIEELRSELVRRGVPPHEIDTIIAQAKTLPRDLVEELVRSVGKGEE